MALASSSGGLPVDPSKAVWSYGQAYPSLNFPKTPSVVSQSSAPAAPTGPTYPHRGGSIGGVVTNIQDAIASVLTRGKVQNADQLRKDLANVPVGASGGRGGSGGGGGLGSIASLSLRAAGSPYDRALAQLGLDYKNNRNQAVLQGQRQDADLAELFKRLGLYEGSLKKDQSGVYDRTGSALSKNYGQLISGIQQAYKTGSGNTNAELQRLGIQSVSPAAMEGLARDGSNLVNQASIDRTNALTNNTANKNIFSSLMQEIIGSAAAEGTSQRGHAKQATADALTQLLNDFVKNKNDLSGKRADAILQARLSNAKMAAAARAAASRGSGGGGSSKTKAKTSGLEAALASLGQYAGGNNKKAVDLINEFRTLQMGKAGNSATGDKGYKFGYSDPNTLNHLYNVWAGANGSGTKNGYGQADADAINRAIAIFFGKG